MKLSFGNSDMAMENTHRVVSLGISRSISPPRIPGKHFPGLRTIFSLGKTPVFLKLHLSHDAILGWGRVDPKSQADRGSRIKWHKSLRWRLKPLDGVTGVEVPLFPFRKWFTSHRRFFSRNLQKSGGVQSIYWRFFSFGGGGSNNLVTETLLDP